MSPLARQVSFHDKQVGSNIRRLRIEKGISLALLGGATSIPSQIIEEYEAGVKSPPLNDLLKIAEFLMVPLSHLLDGVEAFPSSGDIWSARLPVDRDADGKAVVLTREELQASIDVIRERMGSKVADRIVQLIRSANDS